MKHGRTLFLAAAVLFVSALVPAGTSVPARAAAAGLTSSDVQAVVEPVYSFTAPPDAWLNYPDTRMTLGEFAVGELLLASGETLSVGLTPGTLTTADGNALPYTVSFSPPKVFDGSESGRAYNVAIEIDADTFGEVAGGIYTASLLFCVVSRPASETVWQTETVLTVAKGNGSLDADVPFTGILASVPNWWYAAGVAAAICIALILRVVLRKAKTRKKNAREETQPADTER